jgi:hypothetical protein
VAVASIDVVIDTKDVLIIDIDMSSKYVKPHVAGYVGGSTEVMLYFEEGVSLSGDGSTEGQTVLVLPERVNDWRIMVEGSRYTVTVVAWKDSRV